MSSQARQRQPLRKIAEDVLRNISKGFVNPKEKPDWVASIMRQWVSYGGHAAVLTPTDKFWLHLTRHREGYNVEVTHQAGSPFKGVLSERELKPDAQAELLASLNLLQVAEFEKRSGQLICLRVDPAERRVSAEKL